MNLSNFDETEKGITQSYTLERTISLQGGVEVRRAIARRHFAFLKRFMRQQETRPAAMDNGEADGRLTALLESKLTALLADERQLIEQKYIFRQSVREIADGQQTTEKAVESRLSRVRQKLKDAVLAELKNEQPR